MSYISGASLDEMCTLWHVLCDAQHKHDLPGDIRGEFYDIKLDIMREYRVFCTQVDTRPCSAEIAAEVFEADGTV